MNKAEYMNNLLMLCTEKQQDFFKKIYPEGPSKKQINTAIFQIENTLKEADLGKEAANDKIKELDQVITAFNGKIAAYRKTITELEAELKQANRKIEQLSNPVSLGNAEVQERLDLLSALEAGGVDNWEWYDESRSQAGLI